MKATTQTKLLSPQEVAEQLGVTLNTLAVWRCHGSSSLSYVKIGRCVRSRAEDVEAFINAHRFYHADKPVNAYD